MDGYTTYGIDSSWMERGVDQGISPEHVMSLENGMRITLLDMYGLGNLTGYPVDPSLGGSNGHQEYRDWADSRIEGVAKLEDRLMDMTHLDYADN